MLRDIWCSLLEMCATVVPCSCTAVHKNGRRFDRDVFMHSVAAEGAHIFWFEYIIYVSAFHF